MSLRTKFGVLLGLMGLAVLLALGTAWWALDLMQQEVRAPFDSMTDVLVELGSAKQSVEAAGNAVAGVDEHAATARGVRASFLQVEPASTPWRTDEFLLAMRRASEALERVEDNQWSKTRVGASTIPNLRNRLAEAQSTAEAFAAAADHTSLSSRHMRLQAANALYQVHELIELIEARILQDTAEALKYGGELRTRLLLSLSFALILAMLTIALGITLLRRWVLGPIARLRDAAARIAAGDFSHRIPVESANKDEMALLSVEVNHMAGTIKSMQDDRVEQERLAAVGEMVRRLAHNLRNPLAGIRGLAELTRADLGASSPDLSENQTRIITSVDRFEKWLNDLLSVTRPMQVMPNPTEIGPWITGFIDAHRPQAQTLGVTLSLDLSQAPTITTFDARHIEHALSAMLSNAIEATSSPQARGHARSGGHVALSVLTNAQGWQICITDQGQGIPLDMQKKIFLPYFTTKQDGNGIGLAVALQVVTAHGGRIMVDSPWPTPLATDTGQNGVSGPAGTRFVIELPANRPVLASESETDMANTGHEGAHGGQNPHHRR